MFQRKNEYRAATSNWYIHHRDFKFTRSHYFVSDFRLTQGLVNSSVSRMSTSNCHIVVRRVITLFTKHHDVLKVDDI